jgi:hypothetical protein
MFQQICNIRTGWTENETRSNSLDFTLYEQIQLKIDNQSEAYDL